MCSCKNRDMSKMASYDVAIKFKDGKIESKNVKDIKELKAYLESIGQEPTEVKLQRVKGIHYEK